MKYQLLKYCALMLLTAAIALPQSASTTYLPDINGRLVEADKVVAKDHDVTELARSVNGREVPLQQTETHILREGPSGSLIETIVKKYDPEGRLASTDRIVTEKQVRANGLSEHITTYRSDINGRMMEAERRTLESETRGAVTTVEAAIDRPTINGSFATVEKRSVVAETGTGKVHQDETVYRRPDSSTGFTVAVREVIDTTKDGNRTTDSIAHYEPIATSGQLQLITQTQSTTTRQPNGSETSEVNLYGSSWTGRATDNETAPQLRQQEIIERQKGPGGTVVETLSVRQPSPSDPNRLSPPREVSKTICRGKCEPDQKP